MFFIHLISSWSEINAVEIHLTRIRRGLTCSNGALQPNAELDVVLLIVADRKLEVLSKHDSVYPLGVVLELGVVAIEALLGTVDIYIIDGGLELAGTKIGIGNIVDGLWKNNCTNIVGGAERVVDADIDLPIRRCH